MPKSPIRPINPCTTRDLFIQYESLKTHKIVKKCKRPDDINHKNPDPTGPFQGKDGNWYKISAPRGQYNCYMFAMGWIFSVNSSGYGIPGILSKGRIPLTKEDCVRYIISDLKKVGRKVHEVYNNDSIPHQLPKAASNTYWVKVYFEAEGNPNSFHISRKDEKSGRWLHKMGWTEPAKVICENLEFMSWYELLLESGIGLQCIPSEEELKVLAHLLGVPMYGAISRSRWEDRDDAGYNSYQPDCVPDSFVFYKPFAVLRIDE